MPDYSLSLLDKSPIPDGASAAEALARTTQLAQAADRLGFHRFWVAEHHATPSYAGAAPEVLAAWLLAHTRRIRIGSGGVMLQHYSPFKVAEAFRVLSALAPHRVDLGIGKAPGGLPLATRALQSRHDLARPADFEELLVQLDAFLGGALPEGHPLHGAVATPEPPAWPEPILLGASVESAELAARLGWEFCYAAHFDGELPAIERALAAYRAASGRAGSLALHAVAAATRAEAERLAGERRFYRVTLATGQRVNVQSLAAAADFAAQAGHVPHSVEEIHPRVLAGTAEQVHGELAQLARHLGVREFVIDSPVAAFAPRLRSVELLGEALAPAEALAA